MSNLIALNIINVNVKQWNPLMNGKLQSHHNTQLY